MIPNEHLNELISLLKRKREIDKQLDVICSNTRKCQESKKQLGCLACNMNECRIVKAYKSSYQKLYEVSHEIANKVEYKLPSIIIAMGTTDKQRIENLIWYCKEELKEFGSIMVSTRAACKEAGITDAEIEKIEKQFKR